jgi:regulator of sirC expression with transglutaminase-like and TPR domain
MGYHYTKSNFRLADSLAGRILSIDPTAPYPIMYRGMIAESQNRLSRALEYYSKFIEMDDDLPEVPAIRDRINTIVQRQKNGLPDN